VVVIVFSIFSALGVSTGDLAASSGAVERREHVRAEQGRGEERDAVAQVCILLGEVVHLIGSHLPESVAEKGREGGGWWSIAFDPDAHLLEPDEALVRRVDLRDDVETCTSGQFAPSGACRSRPRRASDGGFRSPPLP
jgi:hypothetical protein